MSMDTGYFGGRDPAKVQVFTGTGGNWVDWVKPRGCSAFHIIAIGGAGGGGGGHSAVAGQNRGGGAGGGSGAIACISGSLDLLPRVLFLNPGKGGAGGAATVNGSAGTMSFVSVKYLSTTAADILVQSGAAAAGGGAKGDNGTPNAAAGTAETVAVNTTAILSGAFLWTARVGAIGATGGLNTGGTGTAITALAIAQTCGGAGGAGTGTTGPDTNFSGGAVTGAGFIPTGNGGAAGLPGDSGYGVNWTLLDGIFQSSGGAGGGSNGAAGTGGRGGNGGLGSGGGGGGGAVTGGAGGDGGNGVILVACW